MILAAGLGTRLRPLTDDMPKALVEVGGVPMLQRVAERLVRAGAEHLVINVHPFADEIERFVRSQDDFGVEVRISHERDEPLETGGGLWFAREHFRGDAPFLLHNADVFTDIELEAIYAAHERTTALATLAVMQRESARGLLFDDRGLLGHVNDDTGLRTEVREPAGAVERLAFGCVHVLSPEIFERITERGRFGIFETYLRLSSEGASVLPHRVDGCTWFDIGRPEQLERANELLAG